MKEQRQAPHAKSHLCSVGPRPSHTSFTARSSCLHMHENSSLLGTNVTILDHLSHKAPLIRKGTPLINLGIMIVISTWIFVILTGYCHIGSHKEEFPCRCRQENQTLKEVWEGRGPAKHICDLTRARLVRLYLDLGMCQYCIQIEWNAQTFHHIERCIIRLEDFDKLLLTLSWWELLENQPFKFNIFLFKLKIMTTSFYSWH